MTTAFAALERPISLPAVLAGDVESQESRESLAFDGAPKAD